MKKKALFLSLACISALNAANINTLASSITLNAGEVKQDTTLAKEGNGGANRMSSFDAPNSFVLNGNTTIFPARYILNANNQTTMFKFFDISLKNQAILAMNNYQSLVLNDKALFNIEQGSQFHYSSNGIIISAQYSEYGGAPKFRLADESKFTLQANAQAHFDRLVLFINKGSIELHSNSHLNIKASALRFEKEFVNNGGTLIIEPVLAGTGEGVFNIGKTQCLNAACVGQYSQDTIAVFTNNGGNISIHQDFYNGGSKVYVDETQGLLPSFDPPFAGGGNLTLNGGKMLITGKLLSTWGRSETTKPYQQSQINIYGGELEVRGGLINGAGSTLTFGILNNTMGLLKGGDANTPALKNENGGKVVVDVSGITLNQAYTLIEGKIEGLNSIELSKNTQFLSATCKNGVIIITQALQGQNSNTINCVYESANNGSNTGGSSDNSNWGSANNSASSANGQKTQFELFKQGLNPNDKTLFNALISKFGGEDKFLTSGADAQILFEDMSNNVKNSTLHQAQNMIASFKADSFIAPLNQAFVSKPLVANELIRFDNGYRISPFEYAYKDFYVNTFGGILKAKELKGYLAGLNFGLGFYDANYLTQSQISYAKGQSTQESSSLKAQTKADLFSASFLLHYFWDNLESDFNLNALLGNFKLDNFSKLNSLSDSNANFLNYEANLGFVLGYRFGKDFSFKPFVGVQHYLTHQNAFKENGGLELESKAYTHYNLNGVLGAELRYILANETFIFTKFALENKLYNTQKNIFFRIADEDLKYKNETYKNTYQLSIGAQMLSLQNLKLNTEFFYKRYDSTLNYYGANLSLKYEF